MIETTATHDRYGRLYLDCNINPISGDCTAEAWDQSGDIIFTVSRRTREAAVTWLRHLIDTGAERDLGEIRNTIEDMGACNGETTLKDELG